MPTAHDVAKWLAGLENIALVRPCRVTIPNVVKLGDVVYEGARYTARYFYSKGMQAVIEGKHKAGDPYYHDRFCLLGLGPKHRRKTVYTFEGGEWYLGCYYAKGKVTEHAPFGNNFSIDLWSIPDQKIDHYDEHKRQRVPMSVEYIQ